MQVVMVLYDAVFSNNILDQFFLTLTNRSVAINYDKTNFDTAEFFLPIDADIEKDQAVKIYEENGSDVTKIFSWIVSDIEPVLNEWEKIQKISCSSEKKILFDRKTFSNFALNNQPLSSLISVLQTTYNSNWDNRQSSIQTPWNISIESKVWDSFSDILDEAVQQLWAQWDVVDGVIIVDEFVWKDRTIWVDFVEIVDSLYESNVSNTEITISWWNKNVIVAKDNDWGSIVFPSPLPTKITWVITETFRKWNLTRNAIEALNKQSQRIINYNVSVNQGSIDVDAWDKVVFRLETAWSKYNFLWNILVLKKDVQYTNWTKIVKYWLSPINNTTPSFNKTINKLQRDVRLIQNS